jgi:hypothetical protein
LVSHRSTGGGPSVFSLEAELPDSEFGGVSFDVATSPSERRVFPSDPSMRNEWVRSHCSESRASGPVTRGAYAVPPTIEPTWTMLTQSRSVAM